MSVASRCFVSTPARDARSTWMAIIELLTQGREGADRDELIGGAGVAASIIADAAPKTSPIIVTCDGPRTRIYCLYDAEAIDGSDANEAALGFDPLKGDWSISLPCLASDLDWVVAALASSSSRITARDVATGLHVEDNAAKSASALEFNKGGFLGQ